jgi:putative ABC transport system permease protein
MQSRWSARLTAPGWTGVPRRVTLVMATAGRRDSPRLLSRVGATTTQLLSMPGWQILVLSITGITLGAAAAAASILAVTKALTSAWTPYVTWPPVVLIVGVVLGLTTLSIFIPTTWIATVRGSGPLHGCGPLSVSRAEGYGHA